MHIRNRNPALLPQSLLLCLIILLSQKAESAWAAQAQVDLGFDLRLSASLGNPGARLTREPYVQLITPGSATLRWRTDVPSIGRVRYGTDPSDLADVISQGTSTTEHIVTLQNLSPDTRYYYSIGTASGILAQGEDYFLETASVPGTQKPIRVWVLGDSGRATAATRSVRDAYLGFARAQRTDLMLMLGDNAYENGTDNEMQAAIFSMHATTLRSTPLWPALGNHDTADSKSPPATLPHFVNWTLPRAGEAGGQPSGTEKYYAFNFGNVHFVCLDSMSSDRSLNGQMMNWLRSDLAANTMDWLVAYWHHPPYSKGSSDSDSTSESVGMRNAAVRVLEDGGADLILAGHSHTYERSYLIDGHYGSSSTFVSSMKKDGGNGRENGDGAYLKLGANSPHQGTIFAVPGSATRADGGPLNHPAMAVSLNVLGSMVLDFQGRRLDAKFIASNGAVRDSFTVLKSFPDFVLITLQPRAQAVEPGTDITLAVRAVSSTPVTYQWRKDGASIPEATNAVIQIRNLQEEDEGVYDVLAADDTRSVLSNPARVSLRVPPTVLHPPVEMTVVEGGSVTLSIETVGTLPMGYRWRRGGATLTNLVLDSHQSFYTISNAQTGDEGFYSIALTNEVFYLPGVLSEKAYLSVLPDADGDGLPDEWEIRHGLRPDDPSDGVLDSDGDQQSNREEYVAGTDPNDFESSLVIERIALGQGVAIEFLAASNRTYTVRYNDWIDQTVWTRLADVVAFPTNRTVVVTDSLNKPNRYYQLITPRQP